MDKNDFINLTIHLYQTTDSLVDEEPLKFLLRKKADEILEKLSQHHFSDHPTISFEEARRLVKDIQSLQSLLKVAEAQEESDRLAFFLLGEEYQRVREELEKVASFPQELEKEEKVEEKVEVEKEETVEKPTLNRYYVSPRQEKIINLLQHQPDLEVNAIAQHFSGVTSRTIRRDLDALLEKSLIKRRKVGKQSFYQVNPVDKT